MIRTKDPKKVAAGQRRAATFTREHQQAAGRAGWKAACEKHPDMLQMLFEKARQWRLANPSEPERKFIQMLHVVPEGPAQIPSYEREYQPIKENFKLTLDFAWPEQKVAVEINGRIHDYDPHGHRTMHQEMKLELLTGQGWVILVVDETRLEWGVVGVVALLGLLQFSEPTTDRAPEPRYGPRDTQDAEIE